jgi:G:T-mismatch repair DNA endonuclease (very short patch repair protein)
VADIWTKQKRSEVMSLIRGKGKKQTEQVLRTLLKQNKITGWRRHLPLPGKPDFAYQLIAKATYLRLRLWFSKHKVAVFVDGWLMAFASLQTVAPPWGYLR